MQENEHIENRELRGVSYKLFITVGLAVIGFLMMIEATVLGIYFKQDNRITALEKDVKEVKEYSAFLRVDVDMLKEFKSAAAVKLDNLQNTQVSYGITGK